MAPSPPTRFAGESWRTALAMHARVVGAVIMRDLQTRFGAGYFGFFLGLMMPLGHLFIALVVNFIIGRKSPLGTDITVFLMTGVLPFVLWLYSHRQIMMALHQNMPLLSFPGVDVLDIFLGRITIEIVNGMIVVLIVLMSISMIDQDFSISNTPGFIYGLVAATCFGIGSGMLFGAIGHFNIIALMFGNLLAPIMWVMSGIFFIPDEMAEIVRDTLFFNPLAHIIDDVRTSYYAEYASSFMNTPYMLSAIAILVLAGMSLTAIVRRHT